MIKERLQKPLLPYEMRTNGFFLDSYGNVLPCNGSTEKMSMGNLHDNTWKEIWNSEQAQKVREQMKCCDKNCWMIGSASPAMKQRIWVSGWWIVKHKLMGNKYRLSENKFIN
ncbi:MAG: SPASM domain-containing protein [Butyrivibrio sp.]|nr:SPASM domain-containing protein [Butyrivibrio sp.]